MHTPDLEPFVGFRRVIKNPSLLKAEVLGIALEQVLVHGFDHVLDDFLGVAEHHHGFVEVEQFVVQTGITAGHRALVDDDGKIGRASCRERVSDTV